MVCATTQLCCFLLCWISLQHICRADQSILKVGKELIKETISLQSGSRIYQLQGLRPNTWYEVKISYPASVVCDELVVGIPRKAWLVVILAVVCLVVAFVISYFLPSILIVRNMILRKWLAFGYHVFVVLL
ncbi:hypothetical protein CTI12_AA230710 [Artemisia annua]|uniref:Uncharacterized protein n=1 Tax=Artemisia annua TaxID=35608 RepID=A0A2U1NTP7_ARTAN|nr:hypothetical protein CTI12_AA230710 [Artemisia annua]